jgi:hypothetical protein
LTWETGSGSGHVAPLLQIGRAFKRRGAHVAFAAQRLSFNSPIWDEMDRLLQAPLPDPLFARSSVGKRPDLPPGRSHADVLREFGFDNPAILEGQIRGWRGLIAVTEPDVIVAGSSPGVALAARFGPPVIAVGAPFFTPCPAGPGFADLSDDEPADRDADEELLAVANEVLAGFGEAPLAGLAEGFVSPHRLAFGFAELDPYARLRPEPLLPPIIDACHSVSGEGDEVVVCLPGHFKNDPVVAAALLGISVPVRLDEQELLVEARDHFVKRGAVVEKTAINADVMGRNGAVVFSHGGIGTVMRALMAGVPQVVLIGDREKMVYGDAIERLGVGVMVHAKDRTVPMLRETILNVYEEPAFGERARALAPEFRRHLGAGDTAEQIAERVLGMV